MEVSSIHKKPFPGARLIKTLVTGFPVILLLSVYLHFISLLSADNLTLENIYTFDPKSLPLSLWANINLFALVFLSPFLLVLNIVLLVRWFDKKWLILSVTGWILLLFFYFLDPMNVIGWLFD